jgi:ACS family hexuronate transporter-like MFS transporter
MGKPSKIRNLRWKICVFLLLGTAVNYMDRMALQLTKTDIGKALNISNSEWGVVFMYFSLAYAVMFTPVGRFIDAVGTKVGYSVCLIFWSLVGIFHAGARTASHFILLRGLLGTAEGGSWTGGSRAAAEWFPPKERSFAVGIWNGGSSVGGIIACLLVPVMMKVFGWKGMFVAIGAIGFLWLIGWIKLYGKPQDHSRITDEERDYILSSQLEERPPEVAADQAKIRFIDLFSYRQVWGILLYRLFTDQIWWFYVSWFPSFLREDRNLQLDLASALMIPLFIAADVGSMSGGWFSGFLQKRGWSTTISRKVVISAGCIAMFSGLWLAHADLRTVGILVAVIGCFYTVASANILTLPADIAPKHLTATLMGMSGLLAGIGGMCMQLMTGRLKDTTKFYAPMIAAEAILPIIALFVIWVVAGEIKPITKSREPRWTKALFTIAALGCIGIAAGGILPQVTHDGAWVASRALDPKAAVEIVQISADHPLMQGLRNGDQIYLGFATVPFNIPMAFRIAAVVLGLGGLLFLISDKLKGACNAPAVGLVGVAGIATVIWHFLEVSLRLVSFKGTLAALSGPGFYLLIAASALTILAFGITVSLKPSKAELEAMAA